ncbi:hypothetical protein, partial [Klebsiella pneumoniae]|uniref:hypothetical protein n=1 Tax=Klebsiella pneumoniae TaxID=573 RepID=UPI0019D70008
SECVDMVILVCANICISGTASPRSWYLQPQAQDHDLTFKIRVIYQGQIFKNPLLFLLMFFVIWGEQHNKHPKKANSKSNLNNFLTLISILHLIRTGWAELVLRKIRLILANDIFSKKIREGGQGASTCQDKTDFGR